MNVLSDLGGRTAVVTGGGTGIGRAIALALAGVGVQVAVVGRRPQQLEETVQLIRELGRDAVAFPADVQVATQVQEAVDNAAKAFGRLDILVCSAGIVRPAPASEITEHDWDEVMATNVKGSFFAAQAAARHMAPQKWGRVIFISSDFGIVGFPGRVAYCTSKGGVTQLTRSLAVEWAPLGITVNAVAPTYVETDLTRPYLSQNSFREQILSRIPVGRMASLEEVATAATWLALPASAMITGTTLPVDGGWVAQ